MPAIVLFSKDVKRMAVFYQSVLDADVLERGSGHVVLSSDGMEIVIHSIPARVARDIVIESPPEPRSNTAIKPAFDVADLSLARERIDSLGGCLGSLDKAFRIRGRLVIDGLDPEGNVVQFRQVKPATE